MVVRKGPMDWFPLAIGDLELEKAFYGVTLLTI
jgi:predicted enzyme related to lactoylglutathione lyase